MAAPLSIIIPTLNDAHRIGPTLASLSVGLGEGLIRELIIADGGSADAIAQVAEHAGAVFIDATRGRGMQLAAGAGAAKGSWLLFLHADTELSGNWAASVHRHIATRSGLAAYFRLRFAAAGFAPDLTARWANARSRWFRLPYGDQGLLISRQHYDHVGGYAAIPLMEDVAMARQIGRRMCQLDAVATTNAERYLSQGWLKRGLANHILLARYLAGADPATLARRYT